MAKGDAPTFNDFEALDTYSLDQKAYSLYLYLCQRNTMEDVGNQLFNTDQAGRPVSTVMRCYGFSGQNSNHFKGYNLTIDDFRAFVRKYPHGCRNDFPRHTTIDNFMQDRHKMNSKQASSVNNNNYYTSTPKRTTKKKTVTRPAMDDGYSYNGGNTSNSDNEAAAVGVTVLIAIILIFIFRKKIWAFLVGIIPKVIVICIVIFVIYKIFTSRRS